MDEKIGAAYLDEAFRSLRGHKRLAEDAFAQIDDEQFFRIIDPEEFIIDPGTTRAELMRYWEESWSLTLDTVRSLKPDDLLKLKMVSTRGQPNNVLQAVHRATAHYAYHVGQILFLAKHLKSTGWKSLSIPRAQSNAAAEKKP